jgi:hypothetical protein
MPGDRPSARQNKNDNRTLGNLLNRTRDGKEAPDSLQNKMFSTTKSMPLNSSRAMDTSRKTALPLNPRNTSTQMPTTISRDAAEIPSALRTAPPASAARVRIASAVASAAAFAVASSTLPAPVCAASRAGGNLQAPLRHPTLAPTNPTPPMPTLQAASGESHRGGCEAGRKADFATGCD